MSKKLWRNRRFLIAAIVVLAAILLLILYLHYTSSAHVRRVLVEHAARTINGEIGIDHARIQVLRGLTLDDATLTRPGAAGPDIAVRHIRCDWNAAAFFHADIEPRRLVFVEPRVRLYPDPDGALNVERMFKAKPDDEKELAAPFAYERYFAEGIFVDSARLEWIAPEVFGDEKERFFSDLDIQTYPSPETVSRWDIAALIRSEPFQGARIEGWLDLKPKSERAYFHGEGHELPITPDLQQFLPKVGREVLARLDLSGKATLIADCTYARGAPPEFAFGVELHNTDVRLRPTRFSARAADVSMRFDGRGFVCDRFASVMWDGGLVGGAASHPAGGATAWVRLENADLERMAEEMHIQDSKLRGLLSGSARLRIAEPGAEETLVGEGTVEITNAHLAQLPLLSSVFQILHFRFPSGEVFDRGEAKFSILGDRIYVESLSISSPTVEIAATGTIDFDGAADLVLLVASSDRERGWLITRPIRYIIQSIERQISPPVSVTGPLSNPEVNVLTMEPVTRQLRNLRDLLPFVGPAEKEEK